jgi:hypothetical protein
MFRGNLWFRETLFTNILIDNFTKPIMIWLSLAKHIAFYIFKSGGRRNTHYKPFKHYRREWTSFFQTPTVARHSNFSVQGQTISKAGLLFFCTCDLQTFPEVSGIIDSFKQGWIRHKTGSGLYATMHMSAVFQTLHDCCIFKRKDESLSNWSPVKSSRLSWPREMNFQCMYLY